jgi:hypothetical protein
LTKPGLILPFAIWLSRLFSKATPVGRLTNTG